MLLLFGLSLEFVTEATWITARAHSEADAPHNDYCGLNVLNLVVQLVVVVLGIKEHDELVAKVDSS